MYSMSIHEREFQLAAAGNFLKTRTRCAEIERKVSAHTIAMTSDVGERISPSRTTIAMAGPGRYILGDTVPYAPVSVGSSADRNIAYLSRSNGRKAQGAKFLSQRKPREREAVERTDIGAHTATAVAGPMAVVDDLRAARDEARRVWNAYGASDPSRWRRWARRHAFPVDYFEPATNEPISSAPAYQDVQEFALVLARLTGR